MQVRCLGSMAAFDAGRSVALGGPKQRLVLALLLLHANEAVPVDRLIGDVWGDDPPAAARSSLHSYVSHLRKALGAERIESRGQGYALRVTADEVDRMRFEELLAEGRRLRASDPAAAAAALGEALDLWQGPPFADLGDIPPLQPAIARLEELRLTAIEDRVGAGLDRGLDRELVGELESLTAAHPLRERLWCQLMVALYRSGRQGDALAAFDRARSLLADKLGIDPSHELRSVHERVLRQDPSLHAGVPALKGYELVERLGDGPYGTVWRATQPGVDREVAVKAFRPDLANSPAFIRRFDIDAQRVARIEHPHVVPLYDFWREPGAAFLVLRLLRGGSVRDLLETSGPPDPATAMRIFEQVAEALAAAHRQGVVHGNVKPSNVLLDESGNAFLSDFAIARTEGSTGPPVPPAELLYLSPDRIDGARPETTSDVYALGVLMSELLPETDGGVADVARCAMDGDAQSRPRDATELLMRLRATGPLDSPASGAPATARDVSGIRNPYKGLSAFAEGDAADYFGREAFVARLLARLRERGNAGRFLAVVGPSGSGKTSVVRAGLVPSVRAGALPGSHHWFVAHMVPGDRPFDELAAALRQVAVDPPDALAFQLAGDDGITRTVAQVLPGDGELLLIIDQFEELFTQVADEDLRRRFIDALVPAVCGSGARMRIVVTLRADFYDCPLEYGGLAELMQARTEAVTPLTAGDLERAVTRPAERVGVTVERPLVAQMVADVADQPGALPLVQYALTELFDGQQDAVLSTAAYERIGGITGALARRAEMVFSGLPARAREAARQLFLRLVTPGEGVEDTRRRATAAEVTALAPEQMPAVLSAFGDARLLAFDRDAETRASTVEVAHEALLREWRRLRGWIDAARDDLRAHRRLQAAADDWAAADRDPSFLATGSQLDQYETWRATSGLVADPLEQEYLDASLAHRDHVLATEVAREERERALERRSVRRLRGLVTVLSVAALVAGGLTVFAVTQAQRAARQALVASARELSAAATANLDVDAERSILLALEAVGRTRASDGTVLREAEQALHDAVVASRVEFRLPNLGGAVDWSPDGRYLITEGPDDSGIIDIRDATTGRSVRSFRGHDIDINDVVFSDDGSVLVTTGHDGALKMWDPESGAELAAFTADEATAVVGPSVGPDAMLVAAAWPEEGVVRVIDVASGGLRREIEIQRPSQTVFSPDGTQIAISTVDPQGSAVVFDLDSGERVFTLDHETDVFDVDWSPDGRWISTSTFLSVAHLFDAATGEARFTLYGHSAPVQDTAWSADSTRLATASDDGTAKVWAISDGGAREVRSLAAHDTVDGLIGAAFSPDGERLLTGDGDVGTATVWDIGVAGDAEWTNVPASPDAKASVAFTPDGHVVATGSDAAATMWDATTGERIRRFGPDAQPADHIAVSSDGEFVAGATQDGSVAAWDSDTGEQAWALRRDEPILDLAMGSGQHLFAVSGPAGDVRIYDQSGRQVRQIDEGADRTVWSVAFTADGRYLAVSSSREQPGPGADRVRIWDLEEQEVVQDFDPGMGGIDFHPAGDRIVTASAGVGGIWDVAEDEQLVTLTGHTGDIYETAFSGDGSLVATTGYDGTVRIWDPTSGTQRLTLRGHDALVTEAAFSPDGSRLVSGANGTVRVWALHLDDLIAIARDELTRQFTDEECREYLHIDACPTS